MIVKLKRTNRNRGYYRHHRKRIIKRKKRIANKTGWYIKHNQFGRLDKGKIHCPCWMCRNKTRSEGYKKSEYVRLLDQSQQITEYTNGTLS